MSVIMLVDGGVITLVDGSSEGKYEGRPGNEPML